MEEQEVHGEVVDAEGVPAPGVTVGMIWGGGQQAQAGKMMPHKGVTTDAEGRFVADVLWHDDTAALFAVDEEQEHGGIACVQRLRPEDTSRIVLRPLVRVHGDFWIEELGAKPGWINACFEILPEKRRVAQCLTPGAEFSLVLPPGRYQFTGYGGTAPESRIDCKLTVRETTVPSNVRELSLGTIPLEVIERVRLYGKRPPEWTITEARGISKDIKLADLLGKWVLIEFWDYWCGPCIRRGLPELMRFSEGNQHRRDRVEIVTFHRRDVGSLAELDGHLKLIIREVWGGRPLSLPILLDSTGTTAKQFSVYSVPTFIVIEPNGNIVPHMTLDDLSKKLDAE